MKLTITLTAAADVPGVVFAGGYLALKTTGLGWTWEIHDERGFLVGTGHRMGRSRRAARYEARHQAGRIRERAKHLAERSEVVSA